MIDDNSSFKYLNTKTQHLFDEFSKIFHEMIKQGTKDLQLMTEKNQKELNKNNQQSHTITKQQTFSKSNTIKKQSWVSKVTSQRINTVQNKNIGKFIR